MRKHLHVSAHVAASALRPSVLTSWQELPVCVTNNSFKDKPQRLFLLKGRWSVRSYSDQLEKIPTRAFQDGRARIQRSNCLARSVELEAIRAFKHIYLWYKSNSSLPSDCATAKCVCACVMRLDPALKNKAMRLQRRVSPLCSLSGMREELWICCLRSHKSAAANNLFKWNPPSLFWIGIRVSFSWAHTRHTAFKFYKRQSGIHPPRW